MGLSASQGRMLSLTARMSDLEFQAQNISNAKIRLAQQSAEVSEAYVDALNKQKLVVSAGTSNGNTNYVSATANNLTGYNVLTSTDKQRFLKDATGRVITNSETGEAYEGAKGKKITFTDSSGNTFEASASEIQSQYSNATAFLNATLGYSTKEEAESAGATYDAAKVTYYTNIYSGTEGFMRGVGKTSNSENTDETLSYDAGESTYYNTVYNEIKKSGGYNAVSDDQLSDSTWLYSQLREGNIYLYTDEDKDGTFTNVSYSSGDASLQVKTDDSITAKAEAEYEAKMSQIQVKDKKMDLELKNIDTEHSAVQTEIDSVKKVIDKNIDRSFKTFNA